MDDAKIDVVVSIDGSFTDPEPANAHDDQGTLDGTPQVCTYHLRPAANNP